MLTAYNVKDAVLCSNHVALLQSPFEGTSAPDSTAEQAMTCRYDVWSGSLGYIATTVLWGLLGYYCLINCDHAST